MVTVLGANSVVESGYDVENSLRFNRGSSDSLSFTPDSTTNRKTFTISFWTKIAIPNIGSVEGGIFNAGQQPNNNGWFNIQQGHTSNGDFMSQFYSGAFRNFKLTQRVTDPSAWYHFVVAMDTTQGTNTNRLKYYINGTQVTAFSSPIYPDQNFDTKVSTNEQIQSIGSKRNGSAALVDHFDGYLSEFIMIDGQQLAPDQFGEFDEDSGIWKPIDVSGLTFGDNGYYLEFKQSGTSQNSSGLGADTSGNDNHFAVTNLTAVDQCTDTCTNNFATMNPLDNFFQNQTFTEGNLKVLHDNPSPVFSTIGMTKGKWYMEAKAISGNNDYQIGICSTQVTGTSDEIGLRANDWGYKASDGKYKNSGSDSSYGNTYANGNVIGVYLDLDNNKLYFAKNGTLQASGTGIDITAPASTPLGAYFFTLGANAANTKYTWEVNFGNPVAALSSAVADDNDFGSFEYDPSAGSFDSASKDFLALCTKNLATNG